jgi:RNA-splicing ligase RtcB
VFDRDRGQKVPLRIWARSITDDTLRQLQLLAGQPYVVDFVAAMADAHVSEGVAVGSVFATETTVVPRALGGDLGCGMSAMRLSVEARELDRRTLASVVAALERAIPRLRKVQSRSARETRDRGPLGVSSRFGRGHRRARRSTQLRQPGDLVG